MIRTVFIVILVVSLSCINIHGEYTSDYIKLKNLSKPIMCQIHKVSDSIVTYQKVNSKLELQIEIDKLDWILFADGTGQNYTGKEIRQSDLEEAFEYRPDMDTLDIKGEKEIDYSKLDFTPLKMSISCDSRIVFQIAATELLNQGFLITEANSDVLLLTTDYSSFSPKFLKDIWAGFLGMRNFMIAMSIVVTPESGGNSTLTIRAKARYTLGKGFFDKVLGHAFESPVDYLGSYNEQDEKVEIVHKNTDMYKVIESIADSIKTHAERESVLKR
ncbi:MAG: hypothetical protein GF315_09670 [candidate division Zixibacteria bacterium]|nr:hypothetical protein [candidate division Zixibacteria bacterium]